MNVLNSVKFRLQLLTSWAINIFTKPKPKLYHNDSDVCSRNKFIPRNDWIRSFKHIRRLFCLVQVPRSLVCFNINYLMNMAAAWRARRHMFWFSCRFVAKQTASIQTATQVHVRHTSTSSVHMCIASKPIINLTILIHLLKIRKYDTSATSMAFPE